MWLDWQRLNLGCSVPASEIVVLVEVMLAAITDKPPNLSGLTHSCLLLPYVESRQEPPFKRGRASGVIEVKTLFHEAIHILTEGGFQSHPPWILTPN